MRSRQIASMTFVAVGFLSGWLVLDDSAEVRGCRLRLAEAQPQVERSRGGNTFRGLWRGSAPGAEKSRLLPFDPATNQVPLLARGVFERSKCRVGSWGRSSAGDQNLHLEDDR